MVHPVLTALFDLFLIGSALLIVAGMVAEQRRQRQPAVGRQRRPKAMTPYAVSAPRRVGVGQRRARGAVRLRAA